MNKMKKLVKEKSWNDLFFLVTWNDSCTNLKSALQKNAVVAPNAWFPCSKTAVKLKLRIKKGIQSDKIKKLVKEKSWRKSIFSVTWNDSCTNLKSALQKLQASLHGGAPTLRRRMVWHL